MWKLNNLGQLCASMFWNICFKSSVEAVVRAKFTAITLFEEKYVIFNTPTSQTYQMRDNQHDKLVLVINFSAS
jgi:hypothetical protein